MHQQLPSIGPIHGQLAGPDQPSRHELAEEMAWVHLYRAVRHPPGATEVVKYLNSNPEARSRHEALYLIACETLHAKVLADEQSERTVAAFRAIFVTAPIRTVEMVMAIVIAIPRIFGGKPAPDPQAQQPKARSSRVKEPGSPAKARVDALAKHPEVAQVITGFASAPSAAPTAPSAPVVPEASPDAQASASRGGQAA
jgi:hypothetical protein